MAGIPRTYACWTPRSAIARPAALLVSVSSHIDGAAEIRASLSHVLEAGGVAGDDYADRCWTLEEIDTECKVDGLG
ncbi:hypothetical protein ACFYU9_05135 [Streptomyces sp. NPDC004327]|uniref:hypothetical protein n=1 Tax=Streptomyces sp. NPDC004327 TaxID=3364699 RepID=UPI0036BEBF65